MATDPERERRRLIDVYSRMADGEIQEIAEDEASLTGVARQVLHDEIARRGLDHLLSDRDKSHMAEQPNRDERLVPLARFSTASEAEMVRELLSQNDIASVVQGGNYGALEPLPRLGGFSEIRLLVQQSQLSRALELYEAFFVSSEGALREDEDTGGSE